MFDLINIKYTGTGYFSSAIAMDKAVSKQLFINENIPTPRGITINKKDKVLNKSILKGWDAYPCIAKVNCGGSSVGVYRADNLAELEDAIKKAFEFEDTVIVEQFIEGREFSIGVMEGKALPIIEIAPKVGFYDYKNKYQSGSAIETCPAQLPEQVTEDMQHCAERVFRVLCLQTYARMDFRMDKDYNFYCLEANTLPGMTPTSLLPQEAAVLGIDFKALCKRIIDISIKKYEK